MAISTQAIAAQPAEAPQSGAFLEEIVVTAQRRAENLQDVPIAVSAITAATAAKLGINDTQSISQVVPGLTLNRSGLALIPFLRGIGSNFGTPGFEPSVAIFVDDIYQPTGAGAVFEFNNIQSVEVLKGPQGTLFGRNATGGVLQIRTRDPSFEPGADATVTYGNYETYVGQFYGTTKLSDRLAANLALYGRKQADGFGVNVVTGGDTYDGYSYGIRGKLLYDDGDRTSLLLNATYDKARLSQGGGQRAVPGTFSYGGYNPNALGYWDSSANLPVSYKTQSRVISAKLRHDLGAAQLVAITGFNHLRGVFINDGDATPATFLNAPTTHWVNSFTQEIQLLAPTDAAVKWILGGFYLHDRSRFESNFSGLAFGGPSGQGFTRQRTNSIAGFAQASAEILPRTGMTIGIRYTHDHRSFDASNILGGVPRGPFSGDKSWSALTGRFSLDYKFSDALMAYVAYNRGFKSGVYDLSSHNPGSTSINPPAEPETLNAYTAGLKSEWFNRRVRFNAEAFHYDFKNIQVYSNIATGAGTRVVNAGSARIIGLDADLTVSPTANLTLNANLSLADGEYKSFPGGPAIFPLPPNAPIPIPSGCASTTPTYPTGTGIAAQRICDFRGQKTVQTPPAAFTLSAVYTVPTSLGEVALAASWAHSAGYFFDPDNNPQLKQPSTDIINASIQAQVSESFSVRLWGKNLTQQKSMASMVASAAYYNKYSANPPRTYGVTLLGRF